MGKCIETEKLIAEIERRIQNLRGIAVDNPMLAQTMRLSFEDILSFIGSLQQDKESVEYLRKDALLEWLDGKLTIEGATEGYVGGYDTALKDVIKHIKSL